MTERNDMDHREALQTRDQEILELYRSYLKGRDRPVDEDARLGFASKLRQQKGYSDYDDKRILALISES